jgi:2-methylisocitrate lyase-like PEP mutase family enzyme
MWETAQERPSIRLRALMVRERPLLVPGAYDALSAKIVERVGFSAVYLTSLGTALSRIGLPDVGLITATEVISAVRYTVDAVNIPVIADADNGYGNALNVMRTVRDLISAGAAGLHLDDQSSPPR